MKKYIGGDISWNERQPYLKRMREKGTLVTIPFHKEIWKLQCSCGNCSKFYIYRGRSYCGCGKFFNFSLNMKWVFKDKKFFDDVRQLLNKE